MTTSLDDGLGTLRIEEIYSFVVLAEELSFTRAAERLFITAGGLSRRIAHLEQTLGTELFHRTTRHVELNERGLALVGPALRILQQAATVRATFPSRSGPAPQGWGGTA